MIANFLILLNIIYIDFISKKNRFSTYIMRYRQFNTRYTHQWCHNRFNTVLSHKKQNEYGF